MGSIVKYTCEALAGVVVTCIVENGEPWFKASDESKAFQYKNTDQAIRMHVSDDDKRQQGSLISSPGKSPGLRSNGKNINSDNDKSDQGSNPVKSTGLKGN